MDRLKTIYVAESDYGMSLLEARNLQQARNEAIADVGRCFFRSVRKAGRADIEWVRAMGGHVPARAAIAMETGTATAPQSDVVAKP